MISSTSTLLLATLVFNAVSVFGAPIRIADTVSEVAARADLTTPVQPVARAAVVDVEDHRRRSELGTVSRRSARLVMERDEPFSEVVAAREPEPAEVPAPVEQKREEELRQRRYPRGILHDFYEKREPAPEPEANPEPVLIPVVSRALRYPRRVLQDIYEKREPATSVKETTLITTKVTAFDTPADAAAFAMGQAAGANAANVGASASTLSISIPLPSIPAVAAVGSNSGSSTVVSISQTTTIASPDASATASAAAATGTASAGAPAVTASPAAATASASASASASSSSASSTATSSAAAGAPTGTAGDDKAAGDDKTGDAKPAATGDNTATPPATPNSAEPTVDGVKAVPASTESRRWVKASSQPILRRAATSGASWASAVRRQLMSITSDSE